MTAALGRGVVVIPAYNEAESIAPVIREVRSLHPELDVVVVDDGSTDGTADAVRAQGLIPISHPVNLGYGAAIQTGMLYAVRERYDFLVMMDGDGQHVPGEIRKMIGKLSEGADIVIGSRFLPGSGSYETPLLRRAGIQFFSLMARALGGIRIRDITSGFQAMRREVFAFLARDYPVDFPDAEVIVMLGLQKFRIAEVPTVFRRRERGESMYSSVGTVLYYPFKSFLATCIVLLRLFRERLRS